MKTMDELTAGVPAGPVNDVAEALSDPQIAARGAERRSDGRPPPSRRS